MQNNIAFIMNTKSKLQPCEINEDWMIRLEFKIFQPLFKAKMPLRINYIDSKIVVVLLVIK